MFTVRTCLKCNAEYIRIYYFISCDCILINNDNTCYAFYLLLFYDTDENLKSSTI